MKKILSQKTYIFYAVLLLGACASLLVTNLSYDAEYQLAMAYRLVKGDSLITEMWEPHQTSAFLCAIFMKLFMMITGSATGIVLFLHAAGLLIRLGISVYLCRMISKVTDEISGIIAGVLFLLISPKDLLVPEFSNMQIWFTTLMCLTLADYLLRKKMWLLISSAVCLCLGVLSYPSVLLSYFVMVALLFCYSEKKKRDILIYTGVCAGIGSAFVGYLLAAVGWTAIMDCLPRALAIEPSHTISMADKVLANVINVAKILGALALVGAGGWLVQCLAALIQKKKGISGNSPGEGRWIFFAWYILLLLLVVNVLLAKRHGGTSYPFLVILVLGFWKRKSLSGREKILFDTAFWTGVSCLAATFVLSDHGILQAIPYMKLAVCASALPLYRWFCECKEKMYLKKLFVLGMHAFLLVLIFRCVYVHVPISGRAQICSITSELGLIRSGPAMGIITNEHGAAMQRDSMAEWKQYIEPGDTIWILGEPVDTLGYLYEDVEVGAPSVMSTPTYNDQLLYYWEINPEKYPDVVILASGFGELAWEMQKNEWLMRWLEEEYCADRVVDGNYWRYYFRE